VSREELMNKYEEQYYEEFGYPKEEEQSGVVELHAYVTASIRIRSVGDLRALVKYLDEAAVEDGVNVDTGSDSIYIDLADTQTGAKASLIECGEHIPVKKADGTWERVFDFLVTGHECG
jgi:hypothetical protein